MEGGPKEGGRQWQWLAIVMVVVALWGEGGRGQMRKRRNEKGRNEKGIGLRVLG